MVCKIRSEVWWQVVLVGIIEQRLFFDSVTYTEELISVKRFP